MESISLCRICLATDVRLCSISSHLEDMYETITAMKFKTEDRRPIVACYICHARLQNCYRLRMSCLKSENLLTEMKSSSGMQLQDVLSTNTFRVKSVLNLSLGHELQDTTECHVKEEPLEVMRHAGLNLLFIEDPEDIKSEIEDTIVQEYEPNSDGPSSQSADSVVVEELNDPKTDAEDILLEIEDTIIEGYDSNDAGPSSQSVDSLCVNDPKTNNPVLKKLAERDPYLGTELETENIVFVASNVRKTYSRTGAKLNKHEDNKAMAPHEVDKQTFKHDICSINEGFTITACTEHCMFNEREFKCDVCKKCFKNKHGLTKHVYTHTHKKPFQCDVCNKCFKYKQYFTQHIHTHTVGKQFQCYVCNKYFMFKQHLTRHMYTHTGEQRIQCDVCNKFLSNKHTLLKHVYTHTH